jgi:UDP-N-acetylglucosamine 2-epimerase (non-hydrolysing)
MSKTVMTVVGIRPDFVRMSAIFRKLDAEPEFKHILVHTGQHFDRLFSGVFFEELEIREPDFNLQCGAPGKTHYQVAGEITNKLLDDVIGRAGIHPDIVLFLGDSNSVVCSVALKKEGYKIGHIEAGMRSGDRRMLEEINRTVCDHCSDLLFVYHDDYAANLRRENIQEGIRVVGNTIVEVAHKYGDELLQTKKTGDYILLDIHRPENFKDRHRLFLIFDYAMTCSRKYCRPVKFLQFNRTVNAMIEFGLKWCLDNVEIVPLTSYVEFLKAQYNSLFMISDSGTAQEEPAILGTPVIVPRDYTERPQSMEHGCSYLLHVTGYLDESFQWLNGIIGNELCMSSDWLGNGTTSQQIVDILKAKL